MSLICRSCGSAPLQPILSLGRTPLANALLTAACLGVPEPTYPLDLVFCTACSLVQITETVPPDDLFSEYPYFSSFSDTAVLSAKRLAERLTYERRLDAKSLAMEVASDDGYLLQHYRDLGVPVLGIEPAANIARVADGASAKESTLLNCFGIGADVLDFVVDRSTVKQGHFTPGAHLPLLPPEALLVRRPEYVLLLTWNFADEILMQQAAYRAQGGRFIIPVSAPQIV